MPQMLYFESATGFLACPPVADPGFDLRGGGVDFVNGGGGVENH